MRLDWAHLANASNPPLLKVLNLNHTCNLLAMEANILTGSRDLKVQSSGGHYSAYHKYRGKDTH